MQDIKKSILKRVYLLYFFVIIFSLLILGQIIRIQLWQSKYWKEKAREFAIKQQIVEATKGNIYSDDGAELLATSLPVFELRLNASTGLISNKDFKKTVGALSDSLSALFGDRSGSEYKAYIMKARRDKKRGGYLLIQRNVTYEQVKRVKKFPKFRTGKMAVGIDIMQHDIRVMPYDLLARRTIGFIALRETDKIDTMIKGKKQRIKLKSKRQVPVYAGLEGYYSSENKILTGQNGKRLVRLAPGGDRLPLYNDSSLIEPKNGKDIVTTINIDLQEVAHNSLKENLILNKADHGCAVLMEVSTGHIKAIANLKRDSTSAGLKFSEAFNYAVAEASNPGSTFKLASLLVALEDGVIDTNTRFETGTKVKIFGRKKVTDVHVLEGKNTVMSIFEHSSNIGTVSAIWNNYHANPQKFIDGLYRLKINKPLGLDIYGEKSPDIKNLKNTHWRTPYSLPSMAFGYEVELTPLQILSLYNAVANNGKMVRPMFVSEIREMGKVVERFKPVVLNDSICSKKTLGKVRVMLENVVTKGTGRDCFKDAHYTVAGKTGTAQINFTSRGKEKLMHRASFVGYFPAQKPKYSCIVVISAPSSGRIYGGAVAAPVFKDIADKVYSTLFNQYQDDKPIPKNKIIPLTKVVRKDDYKIIASDLHLSDLRLKPGATALPSDWLNLQLDTAVHIAECHVQGSKGIPYVIGMGVKNAVYVLERAGYKVRITGRGYVKSQTLIKPNEVKIELSIKS